MKILPSNLDDVNDIGRIGNEIYFKKDENEIEDKKVSSTTLHEQPTEIAHAGLDVNNEAENNILEIENNNWEHGTNTVLDSSNKPTINSITSPNPYTHKTSNNKENVLNENETIREDIDVSNEILQKNESSQIQPPKFTEKSNKENLVIIETPTQHVQRVIPTPPTIYQKKIYRENSVIKSNDIVDNYDDEVDYSYEDFAVEYNGRTVIRQNKIRNHTSHQTSFFKRPLLQGFLATTGYPKFYIGESNCSWRISAPIGQKVRITILDINLRCKCTIS